MKNMYKAILTATLLVSSLVGLQAQGDLDDLLKGSRADANYLAGGYISPFLKSFGAGINQGWYNTAKPHKVGGVDFTLSVAMVSIPGGDKSFTVDNSRLQTIKLEVDQNGDPVPFNGTGKVPTAFGSTNTPRYDFVDPFIPGQTTASNADDFDGPAGIDGFDDFLSGRVPVPVFNAGIGLPKGTELKIRWTPELDLGKDGQFKLFGIGVMHDIKQYIPGIKMLPFDLSALVAYSKMDIGVDFNDTGTQRGEFTVKGTTIQALISKKISVITPYAAIGYGISSASLKTKGSYDMDGDGTNETTDPVSVEAKNSGPRLTTGIRLKLLIFTFHVDYTLQKYSTVTGGFGLSIR